MNSTNPARDLTLRLQDLLRQERAALGDFLLLLADFDRRRLWLALGFPSLFEFLRREMGLSAGAAHYRKTAAHLLQRFPEVEAPLRDGRLCITSIVELAKVLSPENRSEVLPRFFHRSRREAKVIAAEICPAEAAPRRYAVTAVRAELPSHSPRSLRPLKRCPARSREQRWPPSGRPRRTRQAVRRRRTPLLGLRRHRMDRLSQFFNRLKRTSPGSRSGATSWSP